MALISFGTASKLWVKKNTIFRRSVFSSPIKRHIGTFHVVVGQQTENQFVFLYVFFIIVVLNS